MFMQVLIERARRYPERKGYVNSNGVDPKSSQERV